MELKLTRHDIIITSLLQTKHGENWQNPELSPIFRENTIFSFTRDIYMGRVVSNLLHKIPKTNRKT